MRRAVKTVAGTNVVGQAGDSYVVDGMPVIQRMT